MSEEVIAIDFGTTHTHVSFGQKNNDRVDIASIEPDHNGTITALLFKDEKFYLYGYKALEEYSDLQDKKGYELCTSFKPDIVKDKKAGLNAKLFLGKIADTFQRNPKMDKSQVIVGVPSGSDNTYKNELKSLMEERFGAVETISEPLGALCHFLAKNVLNYNDILNDVLVIDFGGGTCDFAYCHEGKVIDVDALRDGFYYGGRLFDDLFFQWWEDKNPEKAAGCPESDKVMLLTYTCREIKERFSTAIAQNKNAAITRKVHNYGLLENMTWEEFEQRAAQYSPSKTFLSLYGSENPLFSKNVLDLRKQFRDLLCDLAAFYRKRHDKYPDFKHVVLAGGSSLWRFVTDDVQEILNVPQMCIKREPDPYSTISKGLARIPYMRVALEKKKKKIAEETKEKCFTLVQSEYEHFTPKIMYYVENVWEDYFGNILRDYFKTKITKDQMKDSVAAKIPAFAEKIGEHIESRKRDMARYLHENLEESIKKDAQNNSVKLPKHIGIKMFSLENMAKLSHSDIEKLLPSQSIFQWAFNKVSSLFGFNTDVEEDIAKSKKYFTAKIKVNLESFFKENRLLEKTKYEVEKVLNNIIEDIGILQSEIDET